ncbi:MAG: hypothetical protein ACAF41_32375 [Leptolyngbya sp. BL-A-14]
MDKDNLSMPVSPGQVMPLDEVLLRHVPVELSVSYIDARSAQKPHGLEVLLSGIVLFEMHQL